MNLEEQLDLYIHPARIRPLEVEFAGESYGCDPSISETTVPHVVVYIPIGFIRRYNVEKLGKNSFKLPDAYAFWEFLSSHLVGKGLTARDEYDSTVSVDPVIEALHRWPIVAYFDSRLRPLMAGVILEVIYP